MNVYRAPALSSDYYKKPPNNVSYSQWGFLIFSIVGFIVFIAFYLVFLYIPALEYENEFDTLLDQSNETLALTRDYADTIETYNNVASGVYSDICGSVVNDPCILDPLGSPFCLLKLSGVIGDTFDDFCSNLNNKNI